MYMYNLHVEKNPLHLVENQNRALSSSSKFSEERSLVLGWAGMMGIYCDVLSSKVNLFFVKGS